MLKELLERVLELARPPIISNGEDKYLYADNSKSYCYLKPYGFTREVSNVESFAAYVTEEATRRGNADGQKITVSFTTGGGLCYLSDGDKADHQIKYDRTLSPQWNFLAKHLNRAIKHSEFLRVLQALRPSFINKTTDYKALMTQFRKVTFDEKTTVVSQPLVTEGKSGSSIAVSFQRAGGGTTDTTLPGEMTIDLTYARGSNRAYTAELEVDCEINAKGEIFFTLLWPEIESVVTRAIEDEVKDFREAIEGLPKVLIVVNY